MARPRAYSYDIRCPECGSNRMPKNGTSKNRQVYRCGDCGRHYTHGAAYTRPSAADREQARAMHRAGVSQSAIARNFGVTPPAVYRWLKKDDAPHSPAAGDDSDGKALPADSRPL